MAGAEQTKDLLTEEEPAHRRALVVNTLHWEGEVFAISAGPARV